MSIGETDQESKLQVIPGVTDALFTNKLNVTNLCSQIGVTIAPYRKTDDVDKYVNA